MFGVDVAEGEGEEQEEQEDADDHFVITAARNDEATREGTRVSLGTVPVGDMCLKCRMRGNLTCPKPSVSTNNSF